ncbi:uncharacterized protein BKA78DRAFT_155478 [Phyllosticta capitalensis]|uniref:uncharacterized protein n=1 Tax=Phyllosticta capitalensis TaxID=121624 RepID=UPI0031311E08
MDLLGPFSCLSEGLSLSRHHVVPACFFTNPAWQHLCKNSWGCTWRRCRVEGEEYGTICQPRGPCACRIPGLLPARLLIGRTGPLTLPASWRGETTAVDRGDHWELASSRRQETAANLPRSPRPWRHHRGGCPSTWVKTACWKLHRRNVV